MAKKFFIGVVIIIAIPIVGWLSYQCILLLDAVIEAVATVLLWVFGALIFILIDKNS